MTADTLTAALTYAARGWPVFPLHTPTGDGSCDCRRDCSSPGKHPRTANGLKDATTNPDAIRRWWRMWPDANIGVLTGKGSGLVVLDVDRRKGGDVTLQGLTLPTTLTVTTGDGEHFYFAHPGGDVPSGSDVLPGIDRKGDHAYVVGPPSLHASGRRYCFASEWPEDAPLAPLPAFALNGKRPAMVKNNEAVGGRIATGSRNNTLTRLAGAMRRQGASPDAIEAALLTENGERCDPPLADSDVSRIAASVARYEPAGIAAEGVRFARTDSGNAEMFAHLYGDDVRYDHRRARWLLWTGQRWQEDCAERVYQLAKDATRWRYSQAPTIEDLKERERESAWAIASEARGRLEATLALTRTESRIADAGTDWDADPWVLGVPNGVVDLRTGRLRAGAPEDHITMTTGVVFNPEAKAPRFETFLHEIYGGDGELVGFDQRLSGYSLTGDISEQGFLTAYGRGANGKSVRLSVARLMLGDYAYNAPFQTFELANRPSIPNDLAALAGKRLVTASETVEGARLNESRVKTLTGGDPVTARFLNREWFTFNPVCKIMLAVNHRPRVNDDSYGFWRRVWLVPFTREFRDDADAHLLDKLREELPGILAWAVRGCLEWQRGGLRVPESVKAATEVYRSESDPVAGFLTDVCIVGAHYSVPASTLYKAYRAWTGEQGFKADEVLSSTAFGRQIGERFQRQKGRRGNHYLGVGLLPEHQKALPVEGFVSNNPPPLHYFPIDSLTREELENPPQPSTPSTVDPETFACMRCGGDDLAYDGDTGQPYCPLCRRETAEAS